jgi:hypothetical protein
MDIRRGRPGLKAFAHRSSGAAVDPFIELPLVVPAETIELSQFEQFMAGDFI